MKKNKMIKQFEKIREKGTNIAQVTLKFKDCNGLITYANVDDAGNLYWNCWECLIDVIEELTDGYAAVFSKKNSGICDWDIIVLAVDIHGIFINAYRLIGLDITGEDGNFSLGGGCQNMGTLVNKKQLKAIGAALNATPAGEHKRDFCTLKFYSLGAYGISGAIFYDYVWYAIYDRSPELFAWL